MPWLQLARWQNLLIIFLTQLLAWVFVVLPCSPGILGPVNFLCIALSTLLIAAAGYIINDYFDIRIDTINRPDKVVLEKAIPRKQAIIAHTVLNAIALLLAGYVAAQAHHYEWLLLQAGCTLLLWFYSTDLKKQYMSGNIAVSLLAALTILTLVLYEPVLRQSFTLPVFTPAHSPSSLPVWVLMIYTYFAFMLTWMREIVKDMEDYKGDDAEGCMTMPIKKGLSYCVSFIRVLMALAVIPLAIAAVALSIKGYYILPVYIGALLIVPLCAWAFFIGKDFTTAHYHRASRMLKGIMVLGICSLIIYHFEYYQ